MRPAFLRCSAETLWDKEAGRRIAYGLLSPPGAARLLLADLEPDEPGDVHARLARDLLDGLLVVEDRRLLEQDEVLEERVHPALHDLGQSLLGLALLLGRLLGDA